MWKDIEGYEGLYQVSDTGEVMNVITGKILKAYKEKSGYLRVGLYKDEKEKSFRVHRLVAEAFIPNPFNLPEVNHKSENKQDNRVENLEYCDRKYNINYGTRNDKVAVKVSKTVFQFSKTGEFIREWCSVCEIDRQLGFDFRNVSACCLGKRKSAYGYIWKYKEVV